MTNDFPYPVLTVRTSDALHDVERLRREGHTPLILGGASDVRDHVHNLRVCQIEDSHELVDCSATFDAAAWMDKYASQAEADELLARNPWPGDVRSGTLLWALNSTEERKVPDETVIALLPAAASWMAPCFLRVGGLSSAPDADVHAALARHWQDKYGAHITAAVGHTVEYVVSNPPTTHAAAASLALEHHQVCNDIVMRNYGSVLALAASLLNATVWSFWFD